MATPRAIPVGVRAVAACLSPLLLTLLLPSAGAVAAPRLPTGGPPPARTAAAVPTGPLDTNDRAAVAAAYSDVYSPAAAVTAPAPASDAAARCAAGTSSSTVQDATLTVVNYVRAMSGVQPVTFDPGYSAAAQQAALMMYANTAVSSAPPATWRCWTDPGADGAAHSNLSDTATGASVVRQYMDESGAGNVSGLRRSRLQRPNVVSMGSGTVGSYNALWVSTTRGVADTPSYTTWPSSGYFPAPLEPAGRWSVAPWDVDVDLRRATVAVTGPSGRPLAVTTHPVGSAQRNQPGRPLVFDLGTLPVPAGGRADTYTVTVSGIVDTYGETLDDYQYAVRLFDPAADAPAPVPITSVSAPAVTGLARIGEVLTVTPPTWSTSGVTTTYEWLRDGTSISGATASTYILTPDDVGARISVRATGTKTGALSGASVSAATAPVDKLPATLSLAPSSSDPGQARVAVTVTAPGATNVAGSVDVYDGTDEVASALPVVAGSAVFDADGFTPGDHTVRVVYSGDATVATASQTTIVTVPEPLDPGLTVSASSAAVGALALAVDVRADGQPAAGGTVEVQEGTKTLQSGIAVSAGIARYQATKVTPGRHTYTVRYSGTRRVRASSTTITTTVKAKAKPVLTVTGASTAKGRLTLTIGVTAAGQSSVGGTVKITEGTKVRKSSLTVLKGKARWSATKITKGNHRYTVSYRGTSQIATGSAARTVKIR